MSLTVLLCRHGESRANENDHATTQDVALTPRGERQSEQLAARLEQRDIDAVYTSALQRSRATGRYIAARHEISPTIRDEFREISVGEYNGRPVSEWHSALRTAEDIYTWSPEEGESFEHTERRLLTGFSNLQESHSAGDSIVIVGHGGVNSIFLLHLLNSEPDNYFAIQQGNCCINELEFVEGDHSWILESLNDTSHLNETMSPDGDD